MILFKNCTLLDLDNSETLENFHVLVEGDSIKELSDRPLQSSSAEIFDLKGKILMPGLIDAHVHVTLSTVDIGKNAFLPKSYLAVRSAKILSEMLLRGFTTVRDAGGADSGLVRAIDEGYIAGPRLFISGKAVSQTGGHGDFRPGTHSGKGNFCCGGGEFSVIADGVSELRRAVREELRQGAKQIKIMASGGVASPSDPIWTLQFSAEEIRAVVEEANAWQTYVMAHAYTPKAICHALENGVRSIEHGNLIDDETAKLAAERRAFVVPTLVTYEMLNRFGKEMGFPEESLAKLHDVKNAGLRALEICRKAGVKIGHGSDLLGSLQTHQSEEFSIKSQVLSPSECIRSATHTNADLLNMSGKLGTISPGAFADLLVLDKNPLSDLTALQGQGKHMLAIMKNGKFYKNRL